MKAFWVSCAELIRRRYLWVLATSAVATAVLAFSGFPLLASFGVVTALNVSIALLSTLIVLPPLLVWADEETHLAPVHEDLRPAE